MNFPLFPSLVRQPASYSHVRRGVSCLPDLIPSARAAFNDFVSDDISVGSPESRGSLKTTLFHYPIASALGKMTETKVVAHFVGKMLSNDIHVSSPGTLNAITVIFILADIDETTTSGTIF
mmetsp:Transcript_15473/g.25078  ORF Transcript_15473/g.25078 Transcript_15473/m.25078 type:complete len:121 (-) Transcript_15473:1098-1460(-)